MNLYLAFACSGAAALIYETTWTRLLTLFMGHTVAAASTVLAAFMGGLAGGAALAGKWSEGADRGTALRAYAGMEILIAACALVVPLELALLRPLLTAAYADGDGGATFGAVRVACAMAIVTLPALAMGATLPLASRWHSTSALRAGRDTGLLYASNTAGAAAGAVVSGFVLLPAFGMRWTVLAGVALNAVSAAIAWSLASQPATPGAPRARRPSRKQGAPARAFDPRAALAALAISGCVSLMLQVAWTRIVALALGPTTFAFSAMVSTFITGIAIGSMAGGWATRNLATSAAANRRLPWLLAACLLASGLAAAIAATNAPAVTLVVADAVAAPSATFGAVVRLQAMLLAALMLPMTIGFGAAFPLGVALATRADATVSRDVAHVYTANTAGAITGALAAGFLLIPRIGLQDTVKVGAALAVAGAALVALRAARPHARAVLATTAVTLAAGAAVAFMPAWDRETLSSGAYKYAPYLEGPHRDALLRAGTLLYYREGAAASVSVREFTGVRSLAIDGKADASNGGDMLTQRLLAHVPLLLHESPRRVAIVGLGSGVTLGSALRHPIERAEVLEISPEVVAASRFFEAENHRALSDTRTRLIVGDGRSHMALGRERYDVIISEPSNPWMAGVAALFTQEFFEAARSRLEPGGIVCQWAHTYDISAADLRSIVATFAATFPYASLWLVGEADVLLVGSLGPIEGRLEAVRSAWSRAGVADDLHAVGVRGAETLLTLFTADTTALQKYSAGAALQRDDRLSLEFSAPRHIYGRTTEDNASVLKQLTPPDALPLPVRQAWRTPGIGLSRGTMHLRAEAFRSAYDDFGRAVDADPASAAAVDGFLQAAAGARRIALADARLRGLLARDPSNLAVALAVSRLTAAGGDLAAAGEPLRPFLSRPAPPLEVIEQLASLFADGADTGSLATVVEDLQRLAPESESTLYYTATLHFLRDRPAEAAAVAERLRQINPTHARALNLLGAAYASIGRTTEARMAFEASLAADPREPGTYVNLGTFELQSGRRAEAENYFAQALTIDPASVAAQRGLTQASAATRRQ